MAEGEETRYIGDVLAPWSPSSDAGCAPGRGADPVEYEVLEPLTDPFEALKPDAP